VILAICACLIAPVTFADKDAATILDRARTSIRTLRSLDMTLELDYDVQLTGLTKEVYTIRFIRPNRASVHLVSAEGKSNNGTTAKLSSGLYFKDMVSDGRRYYGLDRSGGEYELHPLSPKGWIAANFGPFQDYSFGFWLDKKSDEIITDARLHGAVADSSKVASIECIHIKVRNPDGNVVDYWIGKTDHLPRMVELSGAIHIVERYTINSMNRPLRASHFVIQPDKKAKQKASEGRSKRGD